MLASGLMSFMIFMVMFSNKELQQYPMRLIMWCTASEAAFYFAVVGSLNQCTLHLNWFYAKTVLISRSWADYETKYDATKNLWEFNSFFTNFTILLTIALNTSLCLDLIWLLKEPLSPKIPRETLLIYGSVLLTFSAAFGIFFAELIGFHFFAKLVGVGIMLFVAVYIGVAIASLIFAV